MKIRLFKPKPRVKNNTDGRSRQKIRRESFIIHHYCPHTYNSGDHFVIRSIRKHIKEYLPEAVFIPKPSSGHRGWGAPIGLRGENINYSNRLADAVIVGGSDPYNNWSLEIRKEEITKLVAPLYLIGLGASSRTLHEQPRIDKESCYEDIRVTNEVARLSSVRDHVTQRFLERLGYDRAVLTGCPALYLFDEEFHISPDGPVALSFPFPDVRNDAQDTYAILLDNFKRILIAVKETGRRAVIVCHDERDVGVAQQVFPEEEYFFSNYVDLVFDMYRRSSVVVGSRLHASILAAALGKPFINVNLDLRGQAFTETFELSGWNVDFDVPDPGSEVVSRLKSVLSGDLSMFDRFYEVKSRYAEVFREFMRSVASDIRESVAF